MKFYQIISMFLVFFLISTLAYVFIYSPALSLPKSESTSSIETHSYEKKIVCTDGANFSCMLGPCDGIRTCKKGQWSECYIIKVCFPGSNTSCNENGCAVGHKTCNECGTGYGECTE